MRPSLTIPEATFKGIIASGKVNIEKSAFDQPNPVWLVVNFTVTDQPVSFRIEKSVKPLMQASSIVFGKWKASAVT